MKTEVDINMSFSDMYRFNIYHAYHGSQGILSIVLALLAALLCGLSWEESEAIYHVVYIGLAVLFAVYVPVTLRTRSKQQVEKSEAFKSTLHYTFDNDGITTAQNEQTATLPWNQVYRLVETKKQLLVYGSRNRAFVLPKEQLGDSLPEIKALAKDKLEKYRLKLRK